MSVRIAWDKYEAALLLDACEKVILNTLHRTQAVTLVSLLLRQKALNNGYCIDSMYRNENGISMQMTIMTGLIQNKKSGLHNASHLFTDIVNIYKSDKASYNQILEEAKSMVSSSKDVKNAFLKYVTSKSPQKAGDIYWAMEIIEQYAIQNKIFICSFYDVLSLDTVKVINSEIADNALFIHKNRKTMPFVKIGISLLKDFVLENEQFLTATCAQENIKSANPFDPNKSFALTAVSDIEQLHLSNPNKMFLFGKTIDVKSWNDLFVIFLSEANNRFAGFLDNFYKKQLLNGGNRLVKAGNISALKRPVHIPETPYYVETNIRAIGLLRAVHKFCNDLNIDKDSFFISYVGTISYITKDNSAPKTAKSPPENQPNDSTTKKVEFSVPCSLAYTKPIKFMYFGDVQDDIKSWSDLYIKIMKLLVEDYPQKLVAGLKLYGDGRIDLGNDSGYSIMKAPKKLFDNLYIEVNLSATDIVKKIKCALDLCNIDVDNLEIHYTSSNTGITSDNKSDSSLSSQSSARKERGELDLNNPFHHWMVDICHLSPFTARGYMSNISVAERIAKEQNLSSWKLISSSDYKEVSTTYMLLMQNSAFREANNRAHNGYTAAINKYLKFLSGDSSTDVISQLSFDGYETTTQIKFDEATLTSYKNILQQKFSKGFRLTSPLDMRKFKAWYAEIEGKELTETEDKIKRGIEECGIVYDDKLFLADTLLSPEVKAKLLSYIEKTFDSGKSAIHFDALFEEFQEDFKCERMYDAEMLKLYLKHTLSSSYHFSRTYISREAFVKIDFDEEIKECLMKHGTPVLTDTICDELAHIPQDRIRWILSANSDFIRNSKGEYFHYSLISLSESDLKCIAGIINNAINEKDYISGNELIEAISKKYPHIIDNNAVLSDLGLRGAIAYSLRDKFSFDSNVISKYGESLSMADVYADFSKNRERFTIDELRLLKNEIKSGIIYFDSVYPNSLRISESVFVSRRNANFNVTATDSAIEMFMNGSNYMALKDITSFGAFPYAGFSWNVFLLEHYVAEFSDKFKLIHTTYNESSCVGAIVRKTSTIDTFDDLAAVAIAESNINLTEPNALNYLCDSGFIAVRRYKRITQALIKANEIRNKKGKK